MGIGGISVWQLLIILAIVFMLFGTKRLRNLGSDLGSSIKGFKKAMGEEDKSADKEPGQVEDQNKNAHAEKVINGDAEKVDEKKS